MNYDENYSRSGASLSALPFLSVGSSAEALKQWLADREEHNYTENIKMASVFSALMSDQGASLNDLDSLSTVVLCDGESQITTFDYDGDGTGAMRLNIRSGESVAHLVIGDEHGSVFHVDEEGSAMLSTLEEWATDATSESSTTLSYFGELLGAASTSPQGLTALIATGLQSTNEDVASFARALTTANEDNALATAVTYINQYLRQLGRATAESYSDDPDNHEFDLTEYTPYKTSSMITGVWSLITTGVSAIGSMMMILGGPVVKAVGAVVTVMSTVAQMLINASRENESITFGSGTNLEYANAVRCTYSTDNLGAYNLATSIDGGDAKPVRISNENASRMFAPSSGYRPTTNPYCAGTLVYPIVKSAMLDSNNYGYRSNPNSYYLATPCGSHVFLTSSSSSPIDTVRTTGLTMGMLDNTYFNYYNEFLQTEYAERYNSFHTYDMIASETGAGAIDSGARLAVLIGYVAAALESGIALAGKIAYRIDDLSKSYRRNLYITGTPQHVYHKLVDYANSWGVLTTNINAEKRNLLLQLMVDYVHTGGSKCDGGAKYASDTSTTYDAAELSWTDINNVLFADCSITESSSSGTGGRWVLTGGGTSFPGFFCNLVYFVAKVLMTECLTRKGVSETTYFYGYDMLRAVTLVDGLPYWSQNDAGEHTALFPGCYRSDTPCAIADPFLYPPKFTRGTAIAAVLTVAAIALVTTVAVIAAKRAWKRHVRSQIVKRERSALAAQSRLEQLTPDDPGYKAAVKDYTVAQRKFQRYAGRVGYSSNSVGTYTTPARITTAQGLLESDYISSAFGNQDTTSSFSSISLRPVISLISG